MEHEQHSHSLAQKNSVLHICSHKLFIPIYLWCLFVCWLCVYAFSPIRGYLCVCVSLEIGTDPWFVYLFSFYSSRPFLSVFFLFNPNKLALFVYLYMRQCYFLSNDPKRKIPYQLCAQSVSSTLSQLKATFYFIFFPVPLLHNLCN